MYNVKPVTFTNKAGLKLFGILHVPEKAHAKNIAIILLSPGVKMRVAPHRLYLNMANNLVEQGYFVFRFDFYALGDSEGNLKEYWLSDVYNNVLRGQYKNDTIMALDWIEKEYGLAKFIVGGLCGGALTGLLTARDDKRIVGLLALGIPAVLESNQTNRVKNITKGQLKSLREGYFRNTKNIKSWIRLLTLKSDFHVIFRSLWNLISNINIKTKKSRVTDKNYENYGDNINPLFAPALFSVLETSRRVLFVFSGADRLYWEFDEKFAVPYQNKLSKYKKLYEVYIIENANHIFSNKVWKEEMLEVSRNWLNKYFN